MVSMIHRLQRIVQEVNRASDIGHAMNLITQSLIEDLGADICSIFLAPKDAPETLRLEASVGINPEVVGKIVMPFGQGLIGNCASKAESINLEDAPSHKDFIHVPNTGETSCPVYLAVPVVAHRDVLGVIVVQRREIGFDEEEEAFLTTLGAQLATSIERVESKEGLNRSITTPTRSRKAHVVHGVAGAPGMAIGRAVVLNRGVNLETVPDKKITDIEGEITQFNAAVNAVCDDLNQQAEKMKNFLPEEECALFVAFAQMLSGGSLIHDTEARIRDGNWAGAGWRDTIEQHAHSFEQMDDEYLAERATDIRDLGVRVFQKMMQDSNTFDQFPDDGILVGDEVTAGDLADVPVGCLNAIISSRGSSSSHVAILAHALGIPAVMGASNLPVSQMNGVEVIVDGYTGTAFVNPDRAVLKEYHAYQREEALIEKDLLNIKDVPVLTTDEQKISLMVNSGLMADLSPSLNSGAEGIGLYRTEIPFQIRDRFPSEEEQFQIYRDVLKTFAGKPVVLRTLDVGGDKPLPYFPIDEDNPFLGWRGIRITLDHPEIFVTQLRAMLRASIGFENLQILLPMITGIAELDEAKAIILRVRQEIQEEQNHRIKMPLIGAMIEVPSAVYQIDDICQRVDFVSVGSNDLTQYLLAVDRNNENVASLYSGLHPAVLKAIHEVAKGAHRNQTAISVCGELAGDPLGVLALIGMGIDSLSMSVGSLLRAKKVILSFSMKEARDLIESAVNQPDAAAVKQLYSEQLDCRGLGGFIRAGK